MVQLDASQHTPSKHPPLPHVTEQLVPPQETTSLLQMPAPVQEMVFTAAWLSMPPAQVPAPLQRT
jgi:hypothetical protein